MPGLIGRKQVDWSIFQEGTTIPIPFHEDFLAANGGTAVARGARHPVILLLDGEAHEAFLHNKDRGGHRSDTLQILYQSNQRLRKILARRFSRSLHHLSCLRAEAAGAGKTYARVPADHAEFLDVYRTDAPFTYRIEIVSPPAPGPVQNETAQPARLVYHVIHANERRTGILMLSRDSMAMQGALPSAGYVEAHADGRRLYALIPPARLAINVLREEKDDDSPNVLRDVLLGWFGPDAWMPGQGNRVAVEVHPSGVLTLTPLARALVSLPSETLDVVDTPRRPARRGVSMTREELEEARAAAQQVGDDGEALVAAFLQARAAKGEIRRLRWTSQTNSVAPYDFAFEEAGEERRVDVKATRGPVGNVVHVSLGELRAMAETGRYDVYRVYDLEGDSGNLQIAEDLAPLAREILAALQELPAGVSADGVAIHPSRLPLGSSIIRLRGRARPEDAEPPRKEGRLARREKGQPRLGGQLGEPPRQRPSKRRERTRGDSNPRSQA